MPLAASTVMITGASRGLGLEFVKQMISLPTPPKVLIATCRNPGSAKELQAIAKSNSAVKVVKLDVEKDEDIESAFKEIKSLVGDKGLNLLINNAGIFDQTDRQGGLKQTRVKLQRHFNINVTGSILVSQKFLPLLKQAAKRNSSMEMSCSKSAIVMISSIYGSQTSFTMEGPEASFNLHYRCSKSAMTMASIAMSRELKDHGILVFSIHPGWVRTDMGTQRADIGLTESITGCLKIIGFAGEERLGKLVSYKGEMLPF